MSCFPEIPCMDSPAAPMPEGRRTCLLVLCLLGGWVVENVPSFFLCRSVVAGALRWRPRGSFAYVASRKSSRAPTPKFPPGGFMLSCCCRCLPLRLDNPLAKSRSRNLVPRFRQSRPRCSRRPLRSSVGFRARVLCLGIQVTLGTPSCDVIQEYQRRASSIGIVNNHVTFSRGTK